MSGSKRGDEMTKKTDSNGFPVHENAFNNNDEIIEDNLMMGRVIRNSSLKTPVVSGPRTRSKTVVPRGYTPKIRRESTPTCEGPLLAGLELERPPPASPDAYNNQNMPAIFKREKTPVLATLETSRRKEYRSPKYSRSKSACPRRGNFPPDWTRYSTFRTFGHPSTIRRNTTNEAIIVSYHAVRKELDTSRPSNEVIVPTTEDCIGRHESIEVPTAPDVTQQENTTIADMINEMLERTLSLEDRQTDEQVSNNKTIDDDDEEDRLTICEDDDWDYAATQDFVNQPTTVVDNSNDQSVVHEPQHSVPLDPSSLSQDLNEQQQTVTYDSEVDVVNINTSIDSDHTKENNPPFHGLTETKFGERDDADTHVSFDIGDTTCEGDEEYEYLDDRDLIVSTTTGFKLPLRAVLLLNDNLKKDLKKTQNSLIAIENKVAVLKQENNRQKKVIENYKETLKEKSIPELSGCDATGHLQENCYKCRLNVICSKRSAEKNSQTTGSQRSLSTSDHGYSSSHWCSPFSEVSDPSLSPPCETLLPIPDKLADLRRLPNEDLMCMVVTSHANSFTPNHPSNDIVLPDTLHNHHMTPPRSHSNPESDIHHGNSTTFDRPLSSSSSSHGIPSSWSTPLRGSDHRRARTSMPPIPSTIASLWRGKSQSSMYRPLNQSSVHSVTVVADSGTPVRPEQISPPVKVKEEIVTPVPSEPNTSSSQGPRYHSQEDNGIPAPELFGNSGQEHYHHHQQQPGSPSEEEPRSEGQGELRSITKEEPTTPAREDPTSSAHEEFETPEQDPFGTPGRSDSRSQMTEEFATASVHEDPVPLEESTTQPVIPDVIYDPTTNMKTDAPVVNRSTHVSPNEEFVAAADSNVEPFNLPNSPSNQYNALSSYTPRSEESFRTIHSASTTPNARVPIGTTTCNSSYSAVVANRARSTVYARNQPRAIQPVKRAKTTIRKTHDEPVAVPIVTSRGRTSNPVQKLNLNFSPPKRARTTLPRRTQQSHPVSIQPSGDTTSASRRRGRSRVTSAQRRNDPNVDTSVEPAPKRRGRPRKDDSTSVPRSNGLPHQSSSVNSTRTVPPRSSTVRRGRGRPRLYSPSRNGQLPTPPLTITPRATTTAQRGRGRPRQLSPPRNDQLQLPVSPIPTATIPRRATTTVQRRGRRPSLSPPRNDQLQLPISPTPTSTIPQRASTTVPKRKKRKRPLIGRIPKPRRYQPVVSPVVNPIVSFAHVSDEDLIKLFIPDANKVVLQVPTFDISNFE